MSAVPGDHASVVVVDDRLTTRAGVRVVLERGGFDVVAEARDAERGAAAAARLDADLCVVAREVTEGGVGAVRLFASRAPGTAVVLLAGEGDEREFLDVVSAGAWGYVLDSAGPEAIVDALRAVLRGEPALPRSLLGVLVQELRARRRGRRLALPGRAPVELTRRQAEVLDYLRHGLTTAQIAERLEISPVTVRRHLATAVAKLDVDSRAEARRLLRSADG